MAEGRRIRVRGQVQGVGFRPFVRDLAHRRGVAGTVQNDAGGVLIHAFGPDLDGFEAALRTEAPVLARVGAVTAAPFAFAHVPAGFAIAPSRGGGADTRVTPDAATCPACLAEIRDPGDRRHGHAFANCTQCGPRFSILRGLPYDRANTAMAAFEICAACRAEYKDPGDRRFHAQPVACPDCGPRLWLERDGAEVAGRALALAAAALRDGQIVAIKGIGGFHLSCDATDAAAVARLRARKRRPTRPLALMGTEAMIGARAAPGPAGWARLRDPAAPILLLARRGAALPDGLAPGQDRLGWMLPHTPLHHLLLESVGAPLVMTSGNLSGQPQAIGNETARADLAGVADAFLMHDREILRRLDDSVEQITPPGPMILRRGRGRVPGTLPLPPGFGDAPQVLAFGGQQKAAICLIKGGQALLSHHLGDLDDRPSLTAFCQADADYAALFDHAPTVFACDLHPGYRSSARARDRAGPAPLFAVQHHHAHLAACLAENAWPRDGGPVAGIVLDGLGLGDDGTIWGGEILLGDYAGYQRLVHLRPAPLIGGEAANRAPWRNLLARLDQAGLHDVADAMLRDRPRDLLRRAAARGVNAPASSSAGRLFDAFAAALGLAPGVQSFEGEAAMALEALARAAPRALAEPYPLALDGAVLDPAPLFRAWHADRRAGMAPAAMAARFHSGLAAGFAAVARAAVDAGRAGAVALSGGCFQNAVLLEATLDALGDAPVLIHTRVPANDGGLALGQALIAAARAQE